MSCRDCEGLGCGECRDSAIRCDRCSCVVDTDDGRERDAASGCCVVCALHLAITAEPEPGRLGEQLAKVARLRRRVAHMLGELAYAGPEGMETALGVIEQLRDDGDQAARMSLRAEARRRERGAA